MGREPHEPPAAACNHLRESGYRVGLRVLYLQLPHTIHQCLNADGGCGCGADNDSVAPTEEAEHTDGATICTEPPLKRHRAAGVGTKEATVRGTPLRPRYTYIGY